MHTIDNPQLRQTSYIAFDANNERLFYTTQNTKYRGIRVYDLKKRKIVKKLNYQRVSNLVYDNASDRLYGIFVNSGIYHLMYYDKDLSKQNFLYTFPFGLSVFDLDVSHDGRYITATISGMNGEQDLIRFDINDLQKANYRYETLMSAKDYNFGQFRFSDNDSSLIGSSYYTGVSNLWKLDIATKQFNLLSNTKTGLFSPLQYSPDSLYALQFDNNGMRPVKLEKKVIEDANAINLLGQKAYERNVDKLSVLGDHVNPLPEIKFGDVYNSITEYNTFKELKFIGAYPEISGFVDKTTLNHITPVLGYRVLFKDAIGTHSLNFSVGVSPWSNNAWKNRFHADVEWQYWYWTLKASWNHTDFYDLFGPMHFSRKGYSFSAAYDRTYTMLPPFEWEWGAALATYGDMETLPLFQNIAMDKGISSLQTASAYIGISKQYKSLGAVMPERGYNAKINAYTYYAGGNFYPSLAANLDGGCLLPFVRNTSFWLRCYYGQSFGDSNSAFGNEYFGGFRNNWVDHKDAYRFREMNAMPGAEIDEIKAHEFAKLTAELNLKPLRYNNFGLLNLYPTYTQTSLFSSYLSTEPFKTNCINYYNVGVQVNTEIVLFKYLKTTWSIGYAELFMPDNSHDGKWMFSLKLF